MTKLRTTTILFGLALGCAVGIVPTTADGADPPSAPAQCPGQSKTPPAACPAPADTQCGDPKGSYAPTVSMGGQNANTNQACYEAWVDHCACVNAKQIDAVYNKPNAEKIRRPSPTRGVVPGDVAQQNGVVIRQYGIDTNLLKTAPPVRGNPGLKSIGGVTVGSPPGVVGSFGPFPNVYTKPINKRPKRPALGTMKLSTQNTWAAHEVLMRAQAATSRCAGKTGADLIACASTYDRSLKAVPPRIGAGAQPNTPSCEDFVYNRYRDIERWRDHVDACGHDAMCKATVTLDANTGIAGKLLSGSDIDANHFDLVQKLFNLGAGNANVIPKCDQGNLTGDKLKACEAARSLPPLAHVIPTYYTPLGGGGQVTRWMTANGVQDVASVAGTGGIWAPASGYFMSKNPFYDPDSLAVISNTVVSTFANDPAKLASMRRLVAELKKGAEYYYVGAPAPNMPAHRYNTEWDYDRAMFNGTKNVSDATFRDYAKRKQFMKRRADMFRRVFDIATEPHITQNGLGDRGSRNAKGAPPAAMKGALLAPNKIATAAAAARARKPTRTAIFTPTLHGALPDAKLSTAVLGRLGGAIMPLPTTVDKVAWNGGANPPQVDPAYSYPRLVCPAPDKVSAQYTGRISRGWSGAVDPNSYTDVRSAACDYVNAILDEWARFDNPTALAPPKAGDPAPGPTGCFSNDLACDWDPREFIAGVEDLVLNQITNVEAARQEEDFKFCKMFGGPVMADPKFNKNVTSTETTLLANMKALLQAAHDAIKDIPVLEKGGMNNGQPAATSKTPTMFAKDNTSAVFGEKRANAETWGNDLFGVGYSYAIGWELPTEWQPNKNKNGYEMCDFGLGAYGKFEAFAYAFGSDKFDIINAQLGAGINDKTNEVVPTDGNTGAYKALLEIAGYDLVNYSASIQLNQKETKSLGDGANSWTLFVIPFQISFVTLEIKFGIGFKYGVDATYGPNHHNACATKENPTPTHPPNPPASITMDAGIKPYGELDAVVDAYASLAGLAGVGAEVQLTLLGLDLPANAHIGLKQNPQKNNEIDFVVGTDLAMDFHTLDGSLSVYAELLFIKLFNITILHWDGFHKSIPIWGTEAKVPLATLGTLGGSGFVNPGAKLNEL